MKCWICGSEDATTHEHMSKASDLRSLFGNPTQRDPLYFHTDDRRNRKVGSLKSDLLKFDHAICVMCNSARTQPHDRAWEHMSRWLRARDPSPGKSFRFNRVFPYDTHRGMKNVHLYFVKAFGCLVVEGGIALDISGFAQAILEDHPHPNLYVGFGRSPDMPVVVAGGSDVHADLLGGKVVAASWFYQVGGVSVNVIYAADGEHRQGLDLAWHPKFGTRRLTYAAF